MGRSQKHITAFAALTTGVLVLNGGVVAHADNFGTVVPNIAEISYTVGTEQHTVVTNEVVFTVQAPVDNNPTIEFFRYAPNASAPLQAFLNGSEYAPSGDLNGPFTDTGEPLNTGTLLDLSGPVPVIPTNSYLSGELMFVRVTDSGANQNSAEIDTLVITVEAENGDIIVLRLYESGPDTGEFWAYMQSSNTATAQHDAVITAANNDELTATYEQVFAEPGSVGGSSKTRVVVDVASVNPQNTVFDSVSGAPINGATITLFQSDGSDANVFGVDGFSEFPSTVVSGETITDSSGLNYVQGDGGFTFPTVEGGDYIIEVIPPEGYNFASLLPPDVIDQNTGAGYFLVDGSFGLPFTLTDTGLVRFDIPLDPVSDLVISKTADRSYGDIGDYINYTVTVQNAGQAMVPIEVHDTLPLGFRYIEGTSQRDELSITDPDISDDASLLTYPMGLVAPGETITLSYALQIGPGAHLGDAVNAAVIRDGNGNALSNVARASIQLREDLLRSTSTIIGRVTENSCEEDKDWARDIHRGDGVEGVRLYMETGAYAVSDPDGLFHFEGVVEGTHVVQVDEETLPQGYEIMVCEANSRYAGKGHSKFVDVQGGGLWRANFYLKQTGEITQEAAIDVFNDTKEYKNFDQDWLNTQDDSVAWVYPETTRTPSKPSVNIGIKHPINGRVELVLNGKTVPAVNLAGRDSNADQTVMISRWRGVDILDGQNHFKATVKDVNGNVLDVLENDIWFVRNIARAHAVPDRSVLVADGRTAPELAIRLEDESGRPVHSGRIATIDVEQPYRLYDETGEKRLQEQSLDLVAPLSARQELSVGPDGLAMVKLEPTLKTGKVTVIVTLDNGRKVPLYLYLEPEKRDWIIVGLAEGTAGYQTIKDNSISLTDSDSDTFDDGRVAFFAKGLIKGNWLMTLAVDTDKRRGGRDTDFASEIDPDAYYTLYGDRSYQELEAQSRSPLYLKLEKRTGYALFGDFDTSITEGRLTHYNRRLTGLKGEYLGETLQVQGFVAETNQGFAKDEIPADGTSGTYQLSNQRVLAQSETITVETRDRNRPDVVLESRTLVRYLDYTLDYLTGQLIFRLPVDVSDASFNPNVIIVDYETAEDAERNLTAGGRIQLDMGKVQVGTSFVKEEGSGTAAGTEGYMVGADIVAQVTDNTEARLEYAITDNRTSGTAPVQSTAMLAEVIHTSERLSAEAYYREEEPEYGLGHTNSNTAGFRRYGAKAALRVNQFEDEKTGRRGSQTLEATAYHEDNLQTGSSRDTAEFTFNHEADRLKASAGIRASRDDLVSGEERESVLAIASASLQVPKYGATIHLAHEQPLSGEGEVTNFPRRTTVGIDKSVASKATVSVRHELLDGQTEDGNDYIAQNTVVGVSVSPWNGMAVTASSDLLTNDSGRRLGGTIGLDQQVKIDKNVSASIGVTNRQIMDQTAEYVDVSADGAVSPLEKNEDFTSAYVGLAYNSEVTSASARIETRLTSEADTFIGSLAAARELSEDLSVAAAVRAVDTDPNNVIAGDYSRIEGRIGTAWRPRGEELVILDRLDVSHESTETGGSRTKIVNNLASNVMIDERWQLSANYGAKYVSQNIAGQNLSNMTHLVGLETRFDVTDKIDLGLSGSALINGDETQYSFGPSIGISPVDNVWVSAGYNFEGFKDKDFEAAEYSREGVYIKLRIKFDQNSARGLLNQISPDFDTVGTEGIAPTALSTP